MSSRSLSSLKYAHAKDKAVITELIEAACSAPSALYSLRNSPQSLPSLSHHSLKGLAAVLRSLEASR